MTRVPLRSRVRGEEFFETFTDLNFIPIFDGIAPASTINMVRSYDEIDTMDAAAVSKADQEIVREKHRRTMACVSWTAARTHKFWRIVAAHPKVGLKGAHT